MMVVIEDHSIMCTSDPSPGLVNEVDVEVRLMGVGHSENLVHRLTLPP